MDEEGTQTERGTRTEGAAKGRSAGCYKTATANQRLALSRRLRDGVAIRTLHIHMHTEEEGAESTRGRLFQHKDVPGEGLRGGRRGAVSMSTHIQLIQRIRGKPTALRRTSTRLMPLEWRENTEKLTE